MDISRLNPWHRDPDLTDRIEQAVDAIGRHVPDLRDSSVVEDVTDALGSRAGRSAVGAAVAAAGAVALSAWASIARRREDGVESA